MGERARGPQNLRKVLGLQAAIARNPDTTARAMLKRIEDLGRVTSASPCTTVLHEQQQNEKRVEGRGMYHSSSIQLTL